MARKLERIRWTIELAASEFGVDRKTVTKGLKALDIEAGADGKYSTADIDKAIHGDLDSERVQMVRAQRIGQEINNSRAIGEIIPTAVAAKLGADLLVPIRQKILSSSLTDDEKTQILEDLVRFGEIDWQQEAIDAS
jgi:hypothetical protein